MASASGFGISSDPLIAAALVSAIAALAASALLITSVLLIRWRSNRVAIANARIQAAWRPRFAAAAAGVEADSRPPTPGEVRAVLELWNQTAFGLRGTAREHLSAYGRRCGLARAAAALVARRPIRDRLLGLTTLGQLGEHSHFATVAAFTADPSPAVSLSAARALIRIDASDGLVALLPRILDRGDWPVARLADALREGPQAELADLLALALARAPRRDLPRLLALARIAPPQQIAPQMRAILSSSSDSETLIAALKLVFDPRDASLVRACVSNEDWSVRVAAIRALGRIAGATDLPLLASALSDPSWWVRQRAAEAIVSLPFLGAAKLEAMRAAVSDPFAADALARAIAGKAVTR